MHAKGAATIHDGGQPLQVEHRHVRRPRAERVGDGDAHRLRIQVRHFRGRDVSLTRHGQGQVERDGEEGRQAIADARADERQQRLVRPHDLQDEEL